MSEFGSEDAQSVISEELTEKYREKEPSVEEKQQLKREHQHHLVRETSSTLSVDSEFQMPGMEVDAEIEVEDIYCFTCSEWIGVSGIELRGTPRSKADAYYLDGPPEDLAEARDTVQNGVAALAEYVVDTVDHVDTIGEGLEFVQDQTEFLENAVSNTE